MAHRYDVRNDPDKLWTVFDVFTGWPAELDGLILTGLQPEEAYDILDEVNQQDVETRKAKGIP
jgi:hypothetical protein